MRTEISHVTPQYMDTPQLRGQLEHYHRASYGWALNCCSWDHLLAEEVLQTVYLKILDGRARFGGKATFRTWLFSVIQKTVDDQRRRSFLRGLRFIALDKSVEPTIEGDGADEQIEKSEMQELVRHALAALPNRQREVLQLVFLFQTLKIR